MFWRRASHGPLKTNLWQAKPILITWQSQTTELVENRQKRCEGNEMNLGKRDHHQFVLINIWRADKYIHIDLMQSCFFLCYYYYYYFLYSHLLLFYDYYRKLAFDENNENEYLFYGTLIYLFLYFKFSYILLTKWPHCIFLILSRFYQ